LLFSPAFPALLPLFRSLLEILLHILGEKFMDICRGCDTPTVKHSRKTMGFSHGKLRGGRGVLTKKIFFAKVKAD
jgi:hypothetical protein